MIASALATGLLLLVAGTAEAVEALSPAEQYVVFFGLLFLGSAFGGDAAGGTSKLRGLATALDAYVKDLLHGRPVRERAPPGCPVRDERGLRVLLGWCDREAWEEMRGR